MQTGHHPGRRTREDDEDTPEQQRPPEPPVEELPEPPGRRGLPPGLGRVRPEEAVERLEEHEDEERAPHLRVLRHEVVLVCAHTRACVASDAAWDASSRAAVPENEWNREGGSQELREGLRGAYPRPPGTGR